MTCILAQKPRDSFFFCFFFRKGGWEARCGEKNDKEGKWQSLFILWFSNPPPNTEMWRSVLCLSPSKVDVHARCWHWIHAGGTAEFTLRFYQRSAGEACWRSPSDSPSHFVFLSSLCRWRHSLLPLSSWCSGSWKRWARGGNTVLKLFRQYSQRTRPTLAGGREDKPAVPWSTRVHSPTVTTAGQPWLNERARERDGWGAGKAAEALRRPPITCIRWHDVTFRRRGWRLCMQRS